MLEKNLCWRKTSLLVKTKIFSRTYFSPTYRKTFHQHAYFSEIISPTYIFHQHLSPTYIFRQQKYFSPTYIKIFTNIIHQHTYNFEWADLFSPTYYFTNIIFTNIMKFRRWMLVKVFHQHTGFSPTYIFHQHPSPTLKQPPSQSQSLTISQLWSYDLNLKISSWLINFHLTRFIHLIS